MSNLSSIKLFATHPHPCSYLPDEESTTVFVDPATKIDLPLYTELSHYGFRRSGNHLYRPQCADCQACIPIRIPVAEFKPNRKQSRCLKKNNDLSTSKIASIDNDECYTLYEKYIEQRHNDGDMHPPSRNQFTEFLSNQWNATQYYGFRKDDKLLAVAVCDQLENGLSAIYTFFDPDESKRSLGMYCILQEIQWAQKLKLPWLYLGYWIKTCKKMNYKNEFKPYQLMLNNHWVSVG